MSTPGTVPPVLAAAVPLADATRSDVLGHGAPVGAVRALV